VSGSDAGSSKKEGGAKHITGFVGLEPEPNPRKKGIFFQTTPHARKHRAPAAAAAGGGGGGGGIPVVFEAKEFWEMKGGSHGSKEPSQIVNF